MINEGKIGETEAVALLTTAVATKIFLYNPAVHVSYGGSAAWMGVIISGLITAALFWVIIKLLQKFPDKSLPDTAEEIMGTFFGIILVLFLFLFWLHRVSLGFRLFSEMIVKVALPETPISIVMVTFLIASCVAVFLGIQNIARACYLSFPFSLSAIFLIVILTYSLWNEDWLFPLFGKGVSNVIKYGILRSSDYIEMNILYVVPFLFYPKQFKSVGFKTIGVSTLIALMVIIGYTITFPAAVGEEHYLPLYMMARNAYLGRFLQRIEAIFVIFWVISAYLWASTGLYGSCIILTRMFKLSDYHPLILPVAIITFSIAFIPANLPDAVILVDYVLNNIAGIHFFGIPALLLIVAVVRGKGKKKSAKN